MAAPDSLEGLTQLPGSPESNHADPKFAFIGYWVDRIVFETLPLADRMPNEVKPKKPEYRANVNVGAGINETEQIAQITLNWEMHGDPKWQPYHLVVVVTGRFKGEGTTPEQFKEFCAVNVPAILFPYIREIVQSATSDGRYGRIRLNPINLQAVLPKEWEALRPTAVSSTESQQPSEQLPAASAESKP